MKSLGILMLLFSLPLLIFSQHAPVVKTKTKLNSDFYKYKSFGWTEMASANEYIKKAIQEELIARGYHQDERNSDLIVSYRVLEKRTRVNGFVGEPTVVRGEESRNVEDTTSYTLEPGTLMVSMIDRKTSEVVWDAFASGLATPDSFAVRPEKAREVVRRIFDEFKHRSRLIEN